MSDVAWLAIAFGVVWLALGAYLLSIQSRQRDLQRRMEVIRQRDGGSS